MNRFSTPPRARYSSPPPRNNVRTPLAPSLTFTEIERFIVDDNVTDLELLLFLDPSEATIPGTNGTPPIVFVIECAQIETCKRLVNILIEKGADIKDTDAYGKNLLEAALARDVTSKELLNSHRRSRELVDLCLRLACLGAPMPRPESKIGVGNEASARCLRELSDAVSADSLRFANRFEPNFWLLVADFMY